MQPPNVPQELASSGGSSDHALHLDVEDHPATITGGTTGCAAEGEDSRGGGCRDGSASGGDGGVGRVSRSAPKQEDLDFFTQVCTTHAFNLEPSAPKLLRSDTQSASCRQFFIWMHYRGSRNPCEKTSFLPGAC